MPHDQAVEIIRQGRGQHFDPDVVDAFLASSDAFHEVALRYADDHEDIEKKAALINKASA